MNAPIRSSVGCDATCGTFADVWESVWSRIASSLDSSTPAESEALLRPGAPVNGTVVQGRNASSGRRRVSVRSRSWNWAAISLIGLAQAAAVLIAVGWGWRCPPGRLPSGRRNRSHACFVVAIQYAAVKALGAFGVPAVEIEAGHWVVIRVEDSAVKVVDLTPDGISYSVDDWLLVFNAGRSHCQSCGGDEGVTAVAITRRQSGRALSRTGGDSCWPSVAWCWGYADSMCRGPRWM